MGDGVAVLVRLTLLVRVNMTVRQPLAMPVSVDVKDPSPPSQQQPRGEGHDDYPYCNLGYLPQPLGESTVEEHQRQAV